MLCVNDSVDSAAVVILKHYIGIVFNCGVIFDFEISPVGWWFVGLCLRPMLGLS
jgi:hypothetical protein